MKYVVTVAGREYDVIVDGDSVTVDGTTMRARLEDAAESPFALVRIGSAVHRVAVHGASRRGEYRLDVDGYRIESTAIDERTRAILALSSGGDRPAAPAQVVAPMPGLIVRVNVAQGDPVRAGQGLVVMEAMKMENELRAPAAGVVRSILVAAGNAVEKGTVLLELE